MWRVLISSVPKSTGQESDQQGDGGCPTGTDRVGDPANQHTSSSDDLLPNRTSRRSAGEGRGGSGQRALRLNARQRRAMAASQLTDLDHPASRELIEAVKQQDIETVEKLLASKEFTLNVNIVDVDDPYRRTPLLYACEHPDVEIARLLLLRENHPADVNAADVRGRRPIWWAAKLGNEELATILLEEAFQECNVNFVDPDSGSAPLYRAILSRSFEVCRLLIHYGADVNTRPALMSGSSEGYKTPLIKAVQLNNENICELLINSLCDREAITQEGFTALHTACAYRRYAICDLLLANGAKKHVPTHHGLTPMVIAIGQRNPYLCKKLIEFGYKINRPFPWDETPLQMAIKYHSEECAVTLVHWGCSLEHEKSDTPSYFSQAACEGQLRLTKLMVDVEPSFLNESWVRSGHVPLALYKRRNLAEWLRREASSPRTLQKLTRSAIYKHLGRYPCAKVDRLPLPESLKAFVGLMDYFPVDMYEQKSIEADVCPYDCLSFCMREECPVLDLSSDEEEDYEQS